MKTSAIVDKLKSNQEDFEWYPTTTDTIEAIKYDVKMQFNYHAPSSVLDIGAGDGRVLMSFDARNKYAIEKSHTLVSLMDDSIFVIGSDFESQTLIDKRIDGFIFCNPPYKQYESWMLKILTEANSSIVYLVVPKRWDSNQQIMAIIKQRRIRYDVILETNFYDADRSARAIVDVIRFYLGGRNGGSLHVDPFDIWFDQHFSISGNYDKKSEYEIRKDQENRVKHRASNLVAGDDYVARLEELYHEDMNKLVSTYKMLEKLDRDLMRELDVNIRTVKEGLKLKINSLKDTYWRMLFDNLGQVTNKLCHNTRRKMLDKLMSSTHIDFTSKNVRNVLIWVIKNASHYFDDQLIEIVKRMTEQANVILYKSNQRTFQYENWRYCSRPDDLSHYTLDYRVILEKCGGIDNDEWSSKKNGGLRDSSCDLVNDLITVANNIGFDANENMPAQRMEWYSGKENIFWYFDHSINEKCVLFTIRAYKKGTLHIKFNQSFILKLNVEFGRLKGWLKDWTDAVMEFEANPESAQAAWGSNMVALSGANGLLRLCGPSDMPNDLYPYTV